MSHYTVCVIGEDVDGQLEPFNENTRVPAYVSKTKKQLIEEKREDYKRSFEDYKEWEKDPEKYEKGCANPNHIEYIKSIPKKLKMTDEQLYKEAIKYYEKEDIGENGEVYSTYNPNSKWDWYQVGGRWAGYFKLKKGASGKIGQKSWCNEKDEIASDRADQARKCDIDFEGMKLEAFERASKTYDEFEALWKSNPEKAKNEAYFTYGVHNVSEKKPDEEFVLVPETREQYLTRCGAPTTFAVLKNGRWYERGEMGWWACVSNEKDPEKWDKEFWKLLESVDDDTLITVVDCHI